MIDEIKKAREAMRAVEESLYASQNRLRTKESKLIDANRLGDEGAQRAEVLEREIAALNEQINTTKTNLQSTRGNLFDLVDRFVLPQPPREQISQLDDSLPFLLLPVRIETRFMNRELWVRVYPDDLAVHTHEKEFTRDDGDSGIEYWIQRALAAAIDDQAKREELERGAWRSLVNSHGGTRASWIAAEIKRRVVEKQGSEDFSFMLIRVEMANILGDRQRSPEQKSADITSVLESTNPLVPLIRDPILSLLAADENINDSIRDAILKTVNDGILMHLGFDLEVLKAESWSQAPRTVVMPDRFVLIGFTGTARLEQPFPNTVDNPLILGPNPQNLESELSQQGGDLVMGEDFDWIANFDKAIQVGMAMRLPLPEPFVSQGFDRLMVLGIRVSSLPADHRELLEELIENHRYSPEGMSFLAQGTATNHTAELRAVFSVDDFEGEASFETETQPSIDEADTELEKTDAERLAAALDVNLESLVPLANARRKDVSDAKVMNIALWPGTLGYYLEELLEDQPAVIGNIRKFFAEHVVARGSLPAIRVGKQPYGILVTSAFRRWQTNQLIDGEDFSFLGDVLEVLRRIEDQWQQLVPLVAHVDAPGDAFANLLNMLGLQATSVDYQRRLATHQNILSNVANFTGAARAATTAYFDEIASQATNLQTQLGLNFLIFRRPKLFGLLFSGTTSPINGPLIDDVDTAEDEKLSEIDQLPRKYAVSITDGEVTVVEDKNYIGWLVNNDINTLKLQRFLDRDGQQLPVPKALLYRMLHRSLLLSTFEASMTVFDGFQLVGKEVRREQDTTNVEAGRTVTRWEFMEANVGRVLPQLSSANVALGDFLATADVTSVPAAFALQEVRDSIGRLEELTTAELERLFAEHIDLCSYRLDAWQTAIFVARLERLNLFRQNNDTGVAKRGLHLGAYGWLENVRPAPPLTPVPTNQIPESLREDGVTVVEQPNNGGHIHGPSINHGVAAAVLRNAYLTHADENNAEHFAVRLTSERVRTALSFLEGVRNGQQLGALLGYQFERALHDRYVVDGIAVAQFILDFRKKYPLVADKITPGAPTDNITQKESYQVIDGYALLEAVMLNDPPLDYPYGVNTLPLAGAAREAIITEVERLKETLDAIADLSLGEGVFQVTQGNYERAGAMLKALTEGNAPPDPEIVSTPRSGAVVNHKVTVHFEPGAVESPWGGTGTPKSLAAPGLNKWLGDLIGLPDTLEFSVEYEPDKTVTAVSLVNLDLQPIDLVFLIGNQASGIEEEEKQINDLTELEARIDLAFRLKRQGDPNFDPTARAVIRFMSTDGFTNPSARTLFELLPLLRNLRKLASSSRPLGADDYMLPSEEKADPNTAENPKRWELESLEQAFDEAAASLNEHLEDLDGLVASFPLNALRKNPAEAGDLSGIDYDDLRRVLIALAYFGLPGAFPKNALFRDLGPDPTDEQRLALLRAQQALIEQALLTLDEGRSRHTRAVALRTFSDLSPEERDRLTVFKKAEIYQAAGVLVLGDSFRFIPPFEFKNRPELESAHSFANDSPPDDSLLRFTQSRLRSAASNTEIVDWRNLAVEEWLEGVAAVRESVALLDAVNTYHEAFVDDELTFKPLQLPFNKKAHWVALEFPEVSPEELDNPNSFVPAGDFLSIVRQLPEDYDASTPQSGLLIDEWNEVIPNRIETTGIAIHYNQPNTEPPQCLLLAVSPNVNGRWEWDDLVETVTDTFDRAKRRAVEPDFLRTTPFAQLLPAVISSFTSFPVATISTNIAAQPLSLVADQP
ncbi:MAG: hypothetical protein ACREBG_16615 [Pyrinomonadaceae bacterium]